MKCDMNCYTIPRDTGARRCNYL